MKRSRRVKRGRRIADDLSFVRPISSGAGEWVTVWPSVDTHSESINVPRESIKISTHRSSAWYDEPFSAERFNSNRFYRDFALSHFDRRDIGQCLLKHEKALCNERGLRYNREEAIGKIASIVRTKRKKLRNLLARSSRVIPKRRKTFV